MLGILVHGDLRPVEHGRLVHVVPHVEIHGTALVLVKGKLVRPPRLDGRVHEVKPGRASY